MKKLIIISLLFLLTIGVNSCTKSDSSNAANANTGVGGSLARFTIVGNYLYIADVSSLSVYNIIDPSNTSFVRSVYIGRDIETIFPNGNLLFIGSQTGMFIYSLDVPTDPVLKGQALHLRSCDPVVAKDSFAFVTLKSGAACGTATDGLYTYNIKDITQPELINTLEIPTPAGLGYRDTTLFVCCENNGLAVINIKDEKHPVVKKMITANTFYDVIVLDNVLVCMVKDGIDLYDIEDVNKIELLKNIKY
ncbi:MAG: hypothetical protein V4556_03575 [Bacteroidota bacterium]